MSEENKEKVYLKKDINNVKIYEEEHKYDMDYLERSVVEGLFFN